MDTLKPMLCSISDTAKALGLGRSKVYELIADERLKTVTIGRRRLVRVESIRALALGEAAYLPVARTAFGARRDKAAAADWNVDEYVALR